MRQQSRSNFAKLGSLTWLAPLALGMVLVGPALVGTGPAVHAGVVAIQVDAPDPDDESIVVLSIDEASDPFGLSWVMGPHPHGPEKALNPDGDVAGDGPPTVLWSHGMTAPLVVWAKAAQPGHQLVWSRFVDGVWTAPATVDAATLDGVDSSAALDPVTGQIHVVYRRTDGGTTVFHRVADASLTQWSAETAISRPGEVPSWPSIAIHQGQFAVAYQIEGTSGSSRIVLARQQGGGLQHEVLADTIGVTDALPQVRSHGERLWVRWIDSSAQLGWRRQADTGDWEPISIEPFTDALDRQIDAPARIRHDVMLP